MSALGFLMFLLIAGVCALIAEAVVPGRVPGGFLVAIVVGVIGAWLGNSLFGTFGPILASVALLPTILGAGIVVFGLALLSGTFYRS
jgi:uncharacterized membrane protein YeaQ/YmgE (transglycosylase-associated protein family)